MANTSRAMQCPWCERWALKDGGCNHVVCGRVGSKFLVGAGCGRQWCFQCGKKLCTALYDAETGKRIAGATEHHKWGDRRHRPTADDPCTGDAYCPGGHRSHK